jgi:hypothetical protein
MLLCKSAPAAASSDHHAAHAEEPMTVDLTIDQFRQTAAAVEAEIARVIVGQRDSGDRRCTSVRWVASVAFSQFCGSPASYTCISTIVQNGIAPGRL